MLRRSFLQTTAALSLTPTLKHCQVTQTQGDRPYMILAPKIWSADLKGRFLHSCAFDVLCDLQGAIKGIKARLCITRGEPLGFPSYITPLALTSCATVLYNNEEERLYKGGKLTLFYVKHQNFGRFSKDLREFLTFYDLPWVRNLVNELCFPRRFQYLSMEPYAYKRKEYNSFTKMNGERMLFELWNKMEVYDFIDRLPSVN